MIVALGAMMSAGSDHVQAQAGFDRPGEDYARIPIRPGDPVVCAGFCDRDPRCRSWSFAYPPGPGAIAMCWLKAKVPPRIAQPCCTSGVKGSGVIEPRIGAIEFGIDRVGGDYHNFETIPDASGAACAAACRADTRCRTWTYSRPGYPGSAKCYLKDRMTLPRRSPCCVSGVVR
ncbi:MAG TPA: PAN domain-containing protein [Xanthobacteraceae bacterium]|nr:PAN domain-containing protein [Xanthobacteraceae bacterium]